MENLQIKSNVVITEQSMNIIRPLAKSIDWNDRLIAVLGAKGTGKATLLLQRLKAEYGTSREALWSKCPQLVPPDIQIQKDSSF